MKKILLAIFIFFLSNTAWAVTYWVSNTGTETTASNCDGATPIDGTAACNFATVNAAVAAGDTVYMRGGSVSYEVYNLGIGERGINPSASGTSYSNMITYATYNDEMVEIDGQCDTIACQNGATNIGVLIQNQSYIKVTGSATNYLKINDCYSNVWVSGNNPTTPAVYANYNEIAYIWSTTNVQAASLTSSVINDNAKYNWVHHCKFERYAGDTFSYHSGNLFQIGTDPMWSGYATDDTQYNIVENSEFRLASHAPLAVSGYYNIVRNNYIHNEGFLWNGSAWVGFRGGMAYGDYDINSRWLLLEGNRIGHADRSNSNLDYSNGFELSYSDAIVRYNSFFNNGRGGLTLRAYIYAGDNPGSAINYARSNDNMIYNNTFFGNNANDTGNQLGPIRFGWSSGSIDDYENETIYWHSTQGNVVKNNLFYDNWRNLNNMEVYDFYGSNKTAASACPPSQTQGCNVFGDDFNDAAGENTDPKFVDESLGGSGSPTVYASWTLPNLNLQSDSPVINQGTYLTTVSSVTDSDTIVVAEASYFQDGNFGSASGMDNTKFAPGITFQADFICIGTVSNCVQIDTVNYSTNTIDTTAAHGASPSDAIWLYKKSDGTVVLYGSAPDYGAYEYEASCTNCGVTIN